MSHAGSAETQIWTAISDLRRQLNKLAERLDKIAALMEARDER